MVKISIIVPVYNAEKYIKNCIESLLSQDVDKEIICINDSSTDGSLLILRQYEKCQKNFRLISYKENNGQAFARNLGMRRTQGKYICFVDADDMLKETSVRKMVEIMEKDHLEILSFDADVIYENQTIQDKYPYNLKRNISIQKVLTGEVFL